MYSIVEYGERDSRTWEYDNRDEWEQAYNTLRTALGPKKTLKAYEDSTEVYQWPPKPSEATYEADLRTNGSTFGLKVRVPADIVRSMDLHVSDKVEVTIRRLQAEHQRTYLYTQCYVESKEGKNMSIYLIRTTDSCTFEEYEIVDTEDRHTALVVYGERMGFMEPGLCMMLLYSEVFNPDTDADTINPMDVCEVIVTAESPGRYCEDGE